MLPSTLEKNPSRDDAALGWQHNPARYRFHGLMKGKVEQRTDPERLGRLRVRVLGIHADSIPVDQLPWASPKTSAWGKGGIFMIPPLQEWVWIQFEDGHIEYPVWSGGWWAAKDAQDPETADGKGASAHVLYPTVNFGGSRRSGDILAMEDMDGVKPEDQPNNYTIISPLNKHIELDDRKGKEKVKLSDQLDNYLWFNTEHATSTWECSRGLQTDKTTGKNRGITLNSKDEVVQVYTFKQYQLTFSDKDDFVELNSPNGYKIRLSEKDQKIELWTKNNQRVVLDDKEERMLAQTAAGRYIQIDDKLKVVRLSDRAGSQIFLDGQNGNNLIKVVGKLHIESTGVMEFLTPGQILMQGQQIHLNGPTVTGANVAELPPTVYVKPSNPVRAKRAPDPV